MIDFHAFSKGWIERRLSPKTNRAGKARVDAVKDGSVQTSKAGLKKSPIKPVVKKRGPNNVTQDYSYARTN